MFQCDSITAEMYSPFHHIRDRNAIRRTGVRSAQATAASTAVGITLSACSKISNSARSQIRRSVGLGVTDPAGQRIRAPGHQKEPLQQFFVSPVAQTSGRFHFHPLSESTSRRYPASRCGNETARAGQIDRWRADAQTKKTPPGRGPGGASHPNPPTAQNSLDTVRK